MKHASAATDVSPSSTSGPFERTRKKIAMATAARRIRATLSRDAAIGFTVRM
jgi:hypothetical protein